LISTSKKILIAPLDWGLGHATRCIPIIHEFLNRGCEVQIASSGSALILLKQELPQLKFHELVSFDVHYSKSLPLALSLFFQLPKFINRIKKEHNQIENIVRDEKIDFVISDNRYGCWSRQVSSVFITHQVNILLPRPIRWLEPFINYFNHLQIKKFNYCWVPDELTNRITGKLTDARGVKITYIGMLSRFKKTQLAEKKYDLLVLLSGPEPQRTLMEQELIKKLSGSKLKVMLVRGIPAETSSMISENEYIVQKNHLSSKELNQVILESEIVISRSGYSTIMDMAKLNKKAIFIPTPGQTEQVYLANQLSKKKIAYCTVLNNLDVNKAIQLGTAYSGFNGEHNNDLLSKAMSNLLT
jgi:uncharacterized protein (TIGR00661 family)